MITLFLLTACGGSTSETPTVAATPEAAPAAAPAEAPAEPAARSVAPGEMVELTDAGEKFAPALEKAQVPEGAWVCDMGTVHYAAKSKGDGKCPVCKMNLTEHKAEGSEAAEGENQEG